MTVNAVEITDDFYFVQRGYLNSNHFVSRGDRPILIDTGYVTHLDNTKSIVAALGIDPNDVSLIVNTHCHCDHVGGNSFFQERAGCEVALHPLGKGWMEARDDWNPWWSYFGQEAVFFDPTRVLEDGEKIPIGGKEWEVLYTPGHARDGICLYSAEERILISSDVLWGSDTPPMVPVIEGEGCLEDALSALDRIEGLDVRLVFPGHGAPFEDVKTALSDTRGAIERYIERPEKMGWDLIKKAIIFQILMRTRVSEESFAALILGSKWYREFCDLYLDGEYEAVYSGIMTDFLERGVVFANCGRLGTVVKV